jgi:hypothetical protein
MEKKASDSELITDRYVYFFDLQKADVFLSVLLLLIALLRVPRI